MALGDQYRARAAELMIKAQGESAPSIRQEYENLGLAYLRLAEQADRNAVTDLVYEHAPERPSGPPSLRSPEDGADD
jgi:hypothetical protein